MMTLVGLDINATRAVAVSGPAGLPPYPLPLDGAHLELPMALSLEGRHPVVGRAGVALCRQLPHLSCLNFLPHVGLGREWAAGRHRLDASQAFRLVLDHLRPNCTGMEGVALVIPAYLTRAQMALLTTVLEKARFPVVGSLTAPLAAALTGYAEQTLSGLAVVVEVDDQALSYAAVTVGDGQVRVLSEQVLPGLSLRAWKGRLIDAVADRCIRQSRRDPRESAHLEQMLYDQLDGALEAARQGQLAEVVLQTASWFQNVVLRADELGGFCAPLARQAADGLRPVLGVTDLYGLPGSVLLTTAAGRLPGLREALLARVGEQATVLVLAPDAPARAAHDLANHFRLGEREPAHLGAAAPLPGPQPVEAGFARLHFRGQDYLLGARPFTLGRQPSCDLVFDSSAYPGVSARHCEIVFDRRTYVLRDRSRNGTLVNDRLVNQQVALHPGDWIRLGPNGPLLRFLGQGLDQHKLGTTA